MNEFFYNAVHQNGEYPLIQVRIDNAGYLIVPVGLYHEENDNFNVVYEVEFLGENYLFSQAACNEVVKTMSPMEAMILMNQEMKEELKRTFKLIHQEVVN